MNELPPLALVATIHDSILTNNSCADLVENILREEFAKDDLKPTFKRKSLEINSEMPVTAQIAPPFKIEFDDGVGGTGGQEETDRPQVLLLPTFFTNVKIRKIPESFKLNGWQYKLVFRESNVAIYEMRKNGICDYETHKIRTLDSGRMKNIWKVEKFERLASEEEFGTFGWAYYNYRRALEKAWGLLQKGSPLPAGICENSKVGREGCVNWLLPNNSV